MNIHPPPVLFGAFDRHNFGDLLFPHLLAALLPGRAFECCGLAERDLRAFGGHRVTPLPARPTQLIHAGGELLTCTA
ncbi:MAG: polysaccharide pyruvyl transferase family protein, partial [Thiobacillus sp.]